MKKWYKQYEEHDKSAVSHPFKLIPLYHYEPRRWRNNSIEETNLANHDYGGWEFPFQKIATAKNAGLFAGFKMYTPLGYRPLDDKLPNMLKYHEKCEKEKIPILNHCSPGGMLTHEQQFYKDYVEKGIQYYPKKKREESFSVMDASSVYIPPLQSNDTFISAPPTPEVPPKEKKQIADDWFSRNYVHLKAWRKVLDKFPNLYTDISCFDIKKNMPAFIAEMRFNKDLWDKVLFGTDWYMTLIVSESGQQKYKDFCRKMKEKLDEIDDSIWIRTSFLNPVKFYGFDDLGKLNMIKKALKKSKANEDMLKSNFKKFKKAINKIEAIKKSL